MYENLILPVFLEKFQNSVMIIFTNFSLIPLYMLYELFVQETNYIALTPFSFGPIQFPDFPLFDTILSNFWLFSFEIRELILQAFPHFQTGWGPCFEFFILDGRVPHHWSPFDNEVFRTKDKRQSSNPLPSFS